MYATNQHHESTHADQVQKDVSPKANLIIWGCFFVLVVLLYFTIAALNSYFRYTVEEEKYIKVGSVVPEELEELHQTEEQILNGEASLVAGKKSISIEQAIDKMIQANHRAGQE